MRRSPSCARRPLHRAPIARRLAINVGRAAPGIGAVVVVADWPRHFPAISLQAQLSVPCQQAMNSDGVLLIIEQVACGPNEPCRGKMTDLGMMVVLGGRNRTEQEYADI